MDHLRRLFFVAGLLATVLAVRAQSTLPTLTQALPAQTLSVGGTAVNIDLRNYFSLPGVTGQIAQFNTVLGTFNVELLASAAPQTVANFLTYVGSGAYSASMIHRSASLNSDGVSNWIVQGGGYTYTDPSVGPVTIPANPSIPLEYNLPNTAGTIAMARGSATNSATTQWFFNVNDNTNVLGASNGGGYAVFGRVLGSGLTVLNALAAVPVYDVSNGNAASAFTNVPLQNITPTTTSIQVANIILVNSVTIVPLYPTDNSGQAVLGFVAANNNSAVVTPTLNGSTLTLVPVGAGTATISIRAADTNNNFTSSTLSVTVVSGSSAPVIASQPVSQNVATGATAVFNVAATGVPTPTYQWQFNGNAIAGATASRLVVPGGTGVAGTYSVVVTNSSGHVASNNAALSFTSTTDIGRLINLSVLTNLTASSPSFTVGTVIGGGTAGVTKPLLVRAVGPSLALVGVAASAALADPALQFYSGSTVIASNDNWGTPVGTGAADGSTLGSAFARVGAFAFANASSKDSAIYNPAIAPGGYTVTVNGVGGATGTVLAEIYDGTIAGTFAPGTPRLLDVSVLKQIDAGGMVTAGFVVGGSTARTVLIRATGPGLAVVGVTSGTLADPQVTLFDGSSKQIATNDNWGGDSQLTAAGASVGAFTISDLASKDAMLLVTLTPGNYSAQVSGVGSASGLALVEVYEVP